MKAPWHSVTLLRALIFLIAGVAIYPSLQAHLPFISAGQSWFLFCGSVVLYLVASLLWHRWKTLTFLRNLQSLSLLSVFLMLGLVRTHQQKPASHLSHFLHQHDSIQHWLVQIARPLKTTEKTFKAEVEVQGYFNPDELLPASGNATGYFQQSERAAALRPGDVIMIKTGLAPYAPPLNPAAFDYGAYQKLQGIHGRFYCDSNAFRTAAHQAPSYWWRVIWSVRQQLTTWLEASLPEGPPLAIGMALLLGEKSMLGEDVRSSFANAGAMHLLAVSGLHVGIILLVSGRVLSLLIRSSYLKVVLLLLIIWGYAFITGLSDSVVRAAVMFTFVVGGELLMKPSHIYNSLTVSAFLLLLWDPHYLFRIGFQLSYAAVLGIVWVYPKMKSYWEPPYKWLRYAWELSCVSVGAQLGTMVLAIAYFHQWPVYGVLSNIPVIVLGTFTLYLGVGHFFMMTLGLILPFSLDFLAWPLSLSLEALYHTTTFFSELPGAVFGPLYWGMPRLGLLSLFLSGFLLHWIWHIAWSRWLMPLGLGGLLLVHVADWQSRQQSATLALYAHRDGPIAGWFPPGAQYIVGPSAQDNTTAPDLAGYQFALGGHWRKMGVALPAKSWLPLDTVVQGRGLALADGLWQLDTARLLLSDTQHNPKVDSAILAAARPNWLWLAQGAKPNFEALRKSPSIRKVILDLSIPPWEYKSLIDSLACSALPVHDMRKDGAFLWRCER